MNIKLEDVKLAYKKLKSYAYYDNSSIILRKQIAEFEDDNIESKLKEIYKRISNEDLDGFIDEIDAYYLPKKITRKLDDFSNIINKEVEIKSVTSFINIPIILQIVGVIWIIKTYKFFEQELSDSVYANRIRNINDSTVSLFKPYYNNYSNWRDFGIKAIENRLKDDKSVVYISMDIKDYYYSIDMNNEEVGFDNLIKELTNYYNDEKELIVGLTEIIKKICTKYSSKIITNRRCILPIGFIPSSILSNWYLKDFDKSIVEEINPIYYGRYVDDIILVCNIYNTRKTKEEIIDKYLIKPKILKRNSKKRLQVICNKYKYLFIQEKKIDIRILDHNYSTAEIKIFKKQIDENRSEFKILPESIEQCIGDIYNIQYNDSKTKIRSLTNIEVDKLELSKTISKIIFKRKQDVYCSKSSEYLNKEIKYIFMYENAIDNFRLWEKVIFYLNQTDNIELLCDFLNNLREAIKKISVKIDSTNQNYKLKTSCNELCNNIKNYLNDNLIMAIAMSGALKKQYNLRINNEIRDIKDIVNEFTFKLLNSNMIRHNYIAIPLINYCLNNKEEDYISFEIDNLIGKELDKRKLEYSPRFMHLHEFILFNYYKELLNNSDKDYLNKSKDIFIKYNYNNDNYKKDENKYFDYNKKLISIPTLDEESKEYCINKIDVFFDDKKNEKIKIAIANIQINDYIIDEIIKGNKKKAYTNLILFKKILNEAAKNEVDFIVLPEASVPIEWITFIGEFTRKHNVTIICGIQHFRIKGSNKIYNNIATIMPIKQGQYTSSLIKFRLKNHYAPFEKELINRYGLEIPKGKITYDLFTWKDIMFTCYNCFELASIEERSLMKGHVDIMFASVLNKDIAYFSKIIDSATRDLHCYFVQVNTSQYGDNRITQPAKKDFKDILRIKGGKNSFLVIGEVDIKQLREFQIMDHRAQVSIKNKMFKPTPPNFKINNSRKKLNLDEIIEK
ncbi:hypothetical protein BH721_02075 [Clostridium baratii]|uniref:Reverse transcriptase (RNA-dependent DNA polymerase) n=1 Tax=Clostridium baratii TaxID=1561 RepID=A0A174R230_9CLOT|nr:nitrilase-related carbon-nitrogen hydrolase [Clostridium baratii]OPF51409.1 hypothetical protein A1M12_02400 [Clostridium baratii]OPF55518.1 hypothetical protein BH721_02075 [Clostridium baratii]OPF57103.1 hypothetical protein BH724_11355 [Clostridium baratii]OPF60101.1 hypothetical protein BH725_05850 [Clostridium baratii]CUP79502.1 Reverse transcriptase (RNA-dependent DNA polymerase) [Clostridium baratii]